MKERCPKCGSRKVHGSNNERSCEKCGHEWLVDSEVDVEDGDLLSEVEDWS